MKNEQQVRIVADKCDNNGDEMMDGHGEDGTGKDTVTMSKRQDWQTGGFGRLEQEWCFGN